MVDRPVIDIQDHGFAETDYGTKLLTIWDDQ
jgi:hypothetical protein